MKKLIKTVVLLLAISAICACSKLPFKKEKNDLEPTVSPVVAVNAAAQSVWQSSSLANGNQALNFAPVVEGNSIIVSNQSGKIEGLSVDSGEREFSIDLDEELVSGVGANANTIIAVSRAGDVIAVDRSDGSEKWRYSVGHILSAQPALGDQVVVVRTIDGQLIGINIITGEQIWGLERSVASLSVGLDSAALIAGEGVITGFSSGRVLANSLFNGRPFWEKRAFRPVGRNDIERLIDIDVQPAIVGQIVIVGAYKNGVVAYKVRDGEELWRNEQVSSRRGVTINDTSLFITLPKSDIAALDLRTGKTLWTNTELHGHQITAPVTAGNQIVVGTFDGDLYFIDNKTGQTVSKLSLSIGTITTLKPVEGGVIAYAGKSGKFESVSF